MEGTLRETVKVSVAGSKPTAGPIVVRYDSFGSKRPANVGKEILFNPFFFDVFVDGVSGGTATIWITHDSITKEHRVHHWDGQKWVDHPEKMVDGKTIKAMFKVSELGKTPIVVGTS